MASEAQPISFPVRQPHEVRLGIGDRASLNGVFRYLRRRASDYARVSSVRPYSDSCRLQRCPFPDQPIKRVAPIVTSGQVDKDCRMTSPDPFCDCISHEELPVILMGNDEHIVLGR